MLQPTEPELIARAQESRVADIYTAMPGRIESYDPETQCADITPMLRRPQGTEDDGITYEDLPVIPNVRVLFPRGGSITISWPLVKGDTVGLLVTNWSMDTWRQSGEVSNPGDLRMHSLGSCFAIPGLVPDMQALPNAMASQNAFIVQGPMVILGDYASADFAALASKTDANFASLKSALNAAKGAAAPSSAGPADVGEPGLASLSIPDLPSVACTRVKVT